MTQLLLFEDEKLRDSFARAMGTADSMVHAVSSVRPRKRIRLSEVELRERSASSDGNQAVRRLYSLLGVDSKANPQDLDETVV